MGQLFSKPSPVSDRPPEPSRSTIEQSSTSTFPTTPETNANPHPLLQHVKAAGSLINTTTNIRSVVEEVWPAFKTFKAKERTQVCRELSRQLKQHYGYDWITAEQENAQGKGSGGTTMPPSQQPAASKKRPATTSQSSPPPKRHRLHQKSTQFDRSRSSTVQPNPSLSPTATAFGYNPPTIDVTPAPPVAPSFFEVVDTKPAPVFDWVHNTGDLVPPVFDWTAPAIKSSSQPPPVSQPPPAIKTTPPRQPPKPFSQPTPVIKAASHPQSPPTPKSISSLNPSAYGKPEAKAVSPTSTSISLLPAAPQPSRKVFHETFNLSVYDKPSPPTVTASPKLPEPASRVATESQEPLDYDSRVAAELREQCLGAVVRFRCVECIPGMDFATQYEHDFYMDQIRLLCPDTLTRRHSCATVQDCLDENRLYICRDFARRTCNKAFTHTYGKHTRDRCKKKKDWVDCGTFHQDGRGNVIRDANGQPRKCYQELTVIHIKPNCGSVTSQRIGNDGTCLEAECTGGDDHRSLRLAIEVARRRAAERNFEARGDKPCKPT